MLILLQMNLLIKMKNFLEKLLMDSQMFSLYHLSDYMSGNEDSYNP